MQIIQEKAKKGPDVITSKKISEKMKEWITLLREKTNFEEYEVEKLVCISDLPYDDLVLNVDKQFGKLDERKNKYQITILNSPKAALIW